jgi:hypothetical protein
VDIYVAILGIGILSFDTDEPKDSGKNEILLAPLQSNLACRRSASVHHPQWQARADLLAYHKLAHRGLVAANFESETES